MNFLGIGPGELLLILLVLLVVVGPERLPGLARQMGRMVVTARNWMQNSPDAAMVLRARQEIEAELTMLKSSLLEVQSIRDEVLDAAKQFNEVVSPLTEGRALDNLLDPAAAGQSPSASGLAPDQAAADATVAATEWPTGGADLPAAYTPITKVELSQLFAVTKTTIINDSEGVPEEPAASPSRDQRLNAIGDSEPALPAGPAISPSAIDELHIRMQAIMTDLWALQEQLKQHGALDVGWQPPSTRIHLPNPQPDIQAEEAT